MAGFHFEPAAPTAASMLAADPALVARYRLVTSRESDTARAAPVRAEVIRFDPDSEPAKGSVYRHLVADLNSGRVAEMCRRHPPMTAAEQVARYAAEMAAGGAQTIIFAAALAHRA